MRVLITTDVLILDHVLPRLVASSLCLLQLHTVRPSDCDRHAAGEVAVERWHCRALRVISTVGFCLANVWVTTITCKEVSWTPLSQPA